MGSVRLLLPAAQLIDGFGASAADGGGGGSGGALSGPACLGRVLRLLLASGPIDEA
jgi:hypothetical protein